MREMWSARAPRTHHGNVMCAKGLVRLKWPCTPVLPVGEAAAAPRTGGGDRPPQRVEESGHSPLSTTTDGTRAALRQCSAGTGKGRAYRRAFAQAAREARVALVQLPLHVQRDRLAVKPAAVVARHVVLHSHSDLQRKARISSPFLQRFCNEHQPRAHMQVC